MWTDIASYQDDSPACAIWTAVAADLARRFNTSLTGLHLIPQPRRAGSDIDEILRARARTLREERAAALEAAFTAVATDIPGGTHWLTQAGDPPAEARRLARFFDLVVAGQPDLSGAAMQDEGRMVEHLLMGSGRPVLLVPRTFAGPLDLGTVLLAWDGSREAARVLADAMPLLRQASAVVVLHVVSEENRRPPEVPRMDHITARLKAKGLPVREVILEDDSRKVGAVLLDEAQKAGAGLLVMGAYGHSRFREMVLGGATRHILKRMTLPVLMSH